MRSTTTHPTYLTGRLHAEAYDTMAHDPNNREVRASYESLATAIVGQWMGLRAMGFVFRPYLSGEGDPVDPYGCSADAMRDIDRATLYVYADRGVSLPFDHPMRMSPIAFGADVNTAAEGFVTLNDVFRGVHDVMGHWKAWKRGEIASFGPVGEYNAWRSHWETLPAEAYLALWCETRGQNAWTNFHADHDTLPIAERPYVDQRAGIPTVAGVDRGRIVNPRRR